MPNSRAKKSTPKKKRSGAGKRGAGGPKAKASANAPKPNTAGIREVQRRNKELLVRVRELELDRVQNDREDGATASEECGAVPEESQGVINIVKDLERQLDNAFALREALEADLAATQTKLSEESAARREVEARAQLLGAQASLAEDLREEMTFVEEERNEIARRLKDAETELSQVTSDRGGLAEQLDAADKSIKNLELGKVDLEAQVLNLKEKVRDLSSVRKELDEVTVDREDLIEQVKRLADRLETSEKAKKRFKQDLATSREVVSGLQAEVEELGRKHTAAESTVTDLSERLEKQQIENRELRQSNKRLKSELKALAAEKQAIDSELQARKTALREIRTAASSTTKRLRSRYHKSAENEEKEDENGG